MPEACCAIIPARGGSKGIPRKNLRELGGKPMIAHTIEAALAAESIARVVVSTDDDEIASVARQFGAEVIMRPAELSTDSASSEAALLHALDQLEAAGNAPDVLVFLQCTSPLTTAEDIDGTVRCMRQENAETAVAVAPFHYFVWKREADGSGSGINHDKAVRPRRQDREDQFLETGAVYAMQASGFARHKHRFFGRTALYVMPAERVLEIDEPADLELAELRLQHSRNGAARAQLPTPVQALVMDFDGVFTDDRVYTDDSGRESVACSRSDGMGLSLLRQTGLPMVVISKERNPVVQRRCDKLQLACLQAIDDKPSALRAFCAQHDVKLQGVVYVGNDINDVECLRLAGCGVVVADAHPSARAAADLVLNTRGGHGALRELTDLIVEHVRGLA